MAKRNEHSLAEIKAMVLSAAENIIAEQGLTALTIRKIAMDMGYTIGSIYMVFSSRAELLQHINARTQADIAAQLQTIDNVETWLMAYLDYARNHTNRWRMIFNTTDYQIQLDSVFIQFSAHFPKSHQQSVRALWLGIQGICLLSREDEWQTATLLLLHQVSAN